MSSKLRIQNQQVKEMKKTVQRLSEEKYLFADMLREEKVNMQNLKFEKLEYMRDAVDRMHARLMVMIDQSKLCYFEDKQEEILIREQDLETDHREISTGGMNRIEKNFDLFEKE